MLSLDASSPVNVTILLFVFAAAALYYLKPAIFFHSDGTVRKLSSNNTLTIHTTLLAGAIIVLFMLQYQKVLTK